MTFRDESRRFVGLNRLLVPVFLTFRGDIETLSDRPLDNSRDRAVRPRMQLRELATAARETQRGQKSLARALHAAA